MRFRKFVLILTLVILIQHVQYAISDGNCTQITTKGTLELQNVTEALLEEYTTCFPDAQRFRFLTTHNITLKELLGYLQMNQSDEVTVLYIRRSSIPQIWENAFINFPNICEIHIENSGIETLATESFSSLAKLTELMLDNNGIHTLSEKTFSRLQGLKSIFLSSNRLTEIHSLVFYYLPNLQNVYLVNNRLKNIADDAFANVANAAIMFKIHIQHNQLEELPYKLLSKVPVTDNFEINARANNITVISEKIILIRGLRILKVGYNNLERVSKHLAVLQKLKYIHLNNNSLQTLPEEMMLVFNRSNGIKNKIYLEGNPWKCNCRLYWMIAYIQRHNVTDEIVCNSPDHVRMIHFNTEDMQCDIPIIKDILSAQLITGIVGICLLGVCCVATTIICLLKTKVKQQKKSAKVYFEV